MLVPIWRNFTSFNDDKLPWILAGSNKANKEEKASLVLHSIIAAVAVAVKAKREYTIYVVNGELMPVLLALLASMVSVCVYIRDNGS